MLKADWEDRNGARLSPPSAWNRYAVAILVIIAAIGGAVIERIGPDVVADHARQLVGLNPDAVPGEFYSRFDIEPLPRAVADSDPIDKHIAALRREPCDWDSTYLFAGDLKQSGYAREGAKVLQTFSAKCKPSDTALYTAADILYGLSDLPAALKISDEISDMSPDQPQFYYLRALILHDLKRYKEALDAYDSLLGLTGDLAALNGEVFRRMSLTYVALGQYCEAMTPLRTWISITPSTNDTPAARAIIQAYNAKGKCQGNYASGKDHFPTQGKDIITATVSVNGVPGVFVVDTGASVVTLTGSFAAKTKLPLSGDATVRMQAAGGVFLAERSSARQLRVGHVEADDVEAIVLSGGDKPLGDGIDGLLGRSFLSRFDVTFGQKEWRIESK
ncbi:aspartyl protease family protein [Rhizobium tubonense]|uniref:Uncharacterized protein n=1 Tax=Rhizobium tubonense TaxID=484088 RepID=A0A2W4C5J7_9HYPH|nr:aspartyl protease family protein [Rhizobium tubonense]PZM08842.1 hypothetical protein CPY51_28165 [Rhizobium tubonense]